MWRHCSRGAVLCKGRWRFHSEPPLLSLSIHTHPKLRVAPSFTDRSRRQSAVIIWENAKNRTCAFLSCSDAWKSMGSDVTWMCVMLGVVLLSNSDIVNGVTPESHLFTHKWSAVLSGRRFHGIRKDVIKTSMCPKCLCVSYSILVIFCVTCFKQLLNVIW